MLLLAASTRLYSALLVLYPEAFQRRYSEEMRQDFFELSREGLEEGGAKELVRVLAQALSDLVLTALRERGTSSAKRLADYLSVDPRIVARAAARATVAVVLVAVGVVAVSLLQAPTYESSARVRVGEQPADQWTFSGASGEGIQFEGREHLPTNTWIPHAIDSRPVAEKAILRLGLQMKPAELLDNLTVEQLEVGTTADNIVLSYEDTDPVEATRIANTVGEVSSELISERSAAGIPLTANVYVAEEAIVPASPVSPHPLKNGLLTLVMGLGLCVGVALALPGVAASVAGKLGKPAVLQVVGRAGIPGGRHGGPSDADVLKEKELLEALVRRGKLTAVEASLESSLSVEEAERVLAALAAEGHLEVTVEHGSLVYALWEHDA